MTTQPMASRVENEYAPTVERLDDGNILRYSLSRNGIPLSCADAIALWRTDRRFRTSFAALLRDAQLAAYLWEMPALTLDSQSSPWEFVLVDCPALAGAEANADPFRIYFNNAQESEVVTFANLGHDATLIAPVPIGPMSAYAHLAAFVRGAPAWQQDQLWTRVGNVAAQLLNSKPVWISTSGLGVHWLHVRVDSVPKYYTFPPYRTAWRT